MFKTVWDSSCELEFSMSVKRRIVLGFIILIVMLFGIGFVSIKKVQELSKISEEIYKHPLTVSNTVRDINIKTLQMYRLLETVTQEMEAEQVHIMRQKLNQLEIVVLQDFATIFLHYLGDQEDIFDAYNYFVLWKPYKQKRLEATLKGTYIADQEDFIQLLEQKTQKLVVFAHAKANYYKQHAKQKSQDAFSTIIILVVSLSFIAMLMGYYLYLIFDRADRKTKRYLKTIDQNIYTVTLDANKIIHDISSAFLTLLNVDRETIVGQSYRYFLEEYFNKEQLDQTERSINSNPLFQINTKKHLSSGEELHLELQFETFYNQDMSLGGYSLLVHDITLQKELEMLSITDGLTGLYNRRYFDQMFPDEIARAKRAKANFIFAIIDVDFFKLYNDFYGHIAGDEVLIAIANVFKQRCLRAGDFAFRLGGEEFGLACSGASYEQVETFFSSLKEEINVLNIPHERSDVSDHVTISVGTIIVSPNYPMDVKDIYKAADALLYDAKTKRNKIEIKKI
jgi:diguanylate cyclase (GGDEF)-like protein